MGSTFATDALPGLYALWWYCYVPRLGAGYVWSLSRQRRNRGLHALHGNGPPSGGGTGWRTVGRGSLTARQLQDLQTASKLRAPGWVLPKDIPADYLVRVYDTRVDPRYLEEMCPDLGLASSGTVFVIGGDFVTKPFREDPVALSAAALRRWGPDDPGPYHLLVQPRPHLAEWFTRARQQLAVEAVGTWISVCCVVSREQCAPMLDGAAIKKLVPQAAAIVDDTSLEVRVAAIGERAPVLRVPADVKELPPPVPEVARLPRNRVLVVVSFRKHAEAASIPVQGCWIRGSLPEVPSEDLELLRLEMTLAPATKQQAGERALRAAVRRVAEAMGVQAPAPSQLRQLQAMHGGIMALLGVPRGQARAWLQGSGCGGLYLRPFWTESTGSAAGRSQFSLLWLRDRLEDGPRIWEAVRQSPGVFGLLATSKDVAVRVSSGVDLPALQAQLQFTLGDKAAQFRRAVPGKRWWRWR